MTPDDIIDAAEELVSDHLQQSKPPPISFVIGNPAGDHFWVFAKDDADYYDVIGDYDTITEATRNSEAYAASLAS